MELEGALRILIAADAGITALVAGRIYPGSLPQTVTYPALSYRLDSRRRTPRLDPRGTGYILTRSVMRFFCTAKGDTNAYSTAKAIDRALFQLLFGYRGTVVNTAVSPQTSVYIHGIFPLDGRDFDFDSDEAAAILLGTKQVVSDYEVWAAEPRPQ